MTAHECSQFFACSDFHSFFMTYFQNRNGRIGRRALRDVMEKFSVRLSDGQFKELLTIVDPTHSNEISYHKFLDLFEPKEDPIEGHKWLNSSHKFNDVQKPAVLAWQTVVCSQLSLRNCNY